MTKHIPGALLALALSAAATSLATGTATAQFYGSLGVGPAFVDNLSFRDPRTVNLLVDNGTAWTITGAVGYRFSPMVRTELELGYLDGSGKGTFQQNIITIAACGITPSQPCLDAAVTSDSKAKTAMAMGYLDIPTDTMITPYVGAGAGFLRQSLDVTGTARTGTGAGSPFTILDDSDTELALRGAAGITLDFGGNVEGDLGYTYTRASRPKLAGKGAFVAFNVNERAEVHAIKATARYKF
ncbi:MAG: outer membrane beta-barrel protein [Rhodospirillaceae bacterium]|nr:outer membrane beta-barrel protein [Rhodospirillaceae bacterium]